MGDNTVVRVDTIRHTLLFPATGEELNFRPDAPPDRDYATSPPDGEVWGTPYWGNGLYMPHAVDADQTLFYGVNFAFANRYGVSLNFYGAAAVTSVIGHLAVGAHQIGRSQFNYTGCEDGGFILWLPERRRDKLRAIAPTGRGIAKGVHRMLKLTAEMPDPLTDDLQVASDHYVAALAAALEETYAEDKEQQVNDLIASLGLFGGQSDAA